MAADAFDAASLTFALPFVSFFEAFEAAALFDGALFDAGLADARAGLAGFFDFGAGLEDLNADAPDRPAGGGARAGNLAGRKTKTWLGPMRSAGRHGMISRSCLLTRDRLGPFRGPESAVARVCSKIAGGSLDILGVRCFSDVARRFEAENPKTRRQSQATRRNYHNISRYHKTSSEANRRAR
ncbi:MAG TPA: hypothetical protein VEV38_00325 [Candidatus Eremiobacteraceae bacterium]|nr:hypothetical protein [Candidatus Eremiobacteraceae bacterium]